MATRKIKAKRTGKEYTYSYSYTSTLVTEPFTAAEKELIDIAYHRRSLKAVDCDVPYKLTKRKFVHDLLIEAVKREVGYDEGSK